MSAEPEDVAEWQDAVDAAYACLSLDAARKYGLVAGGPAVYVHRCEDILTRGAEMGIVPRADVVDRFVAELVVRAGAA